MNGASLFYQGVELRNVRTLRFEQRSRYDSSGTDLLHHTFTIRVEGVVHAGDAAHLGAAAPSPAATAAGAVAAIRTALMQPRGALVYQVNEEIVLQADATKTSAHRDVNNGPLPRFFDIRQIAAGRLFRVEFEIEVALAEPGPSSGNAPSGVARSGDVLSHRWTFEETRDEDFFATREWKGRLRVAHADCNPHHYRRLTLPPLSAGYRRQRMQFVAAADGLTLDYTITDQQQHAAPPAPATDWEATYSEATGNEGGHGFAEVKVRLSGPPNARKRDLAAACAAVVEARLGDLRRSLGQSGNAHLKSATIIEHLHSNDVEMQVRVLRAASGARFLNNPTKKLGRPLAISGYDPQQALLPTAYDASTPAGAFAMYLQSPHEPAHGMTQSATLTPIGQSPTRAAGAAVEYLSSPGTLPQDDSIGLSPFHVQHPYTHVEIENRYRVQSGRKQAPLCTPTASGATSALINMHPPQAQREFYMKAERIGDWPELPRPEDTFDPNGIAEALLEEEVLTAAPELMPDGKTLLYRVEAKYVFALSRAPTLLEKLRAGSSPIDVTSPNQNLYDGARRLTTGRII